MQPILLTIKSIVPGLDAHPVIISIVRPRPIGTFFHTHDYYEFMYITEGSGIHSINGETHQVYRGMILFMRPHDYHDFGIGDGERLHFYNIAFRAELWIEFCRFAGVDPDCPGDGDPKAGSPILVARARQADCEEIFRRAYKEMLDSTPRLELCRFWTMALPFLRNNNFASVSDSDANNQPAWLAHACRDMCDPQNLSSGLPKFIELSRVSPAHLARSLRATTGQSPTQYINNLRIKRAGMMLLTTPEEIADIALDCGFESLSYFYRQFRRHFGKTPREYRHGV